jgi:GAF domain-containing protein
MPVSSIERLQTLYGVSLALSSELDLQALLPEVIDQVIAVTGAERGFLMLGGGKDDLVFHVARGLDQATIESPEFEVSRGVVEKVADSGEPVRSLDAQTEGWLAERKSIHQLKLRSLMCVPLKAKGRSIGLVYVDNRMQAGIFTPDDLALLEAVASSAAVAIENARLYSLAVQQARMERELELASELQAALIPARAPSIPGLELAGQWHAALEVAGDFYDFIPLSNGRLVVVIGDVTDKGVPAAFFMGLSRTTLRASLAADLSLSQAIEQANRLLCADSSGGMFVTLFAISLDP